MFIDITLITKAVHHSQKKLIVDHMGGAGVCCLSTGVIIKERFLHTANVGLILMDCQMNTKLVQTSVGTTGATNLGFV